MKRPKPHSRRPRPTRTRPVIVGTLSTLAGLRRAAASRRIRCDWIEIRFDLIGLKHLSAVLKILPRLRGKRRTLLGTIRSPLEGGRGPRSQARRLEWFRKIAPHVDALDVEASSGAVLRALASERSRPLVISLHDFRGVPSAARLRRHVAAALRQPAALAKIACRVDRPPQLLRLRDLLRRAPAGRVACLGMGELGPFSRFWLPYQGSVLTYGFLDRSAAPGQVSAAELMDFFRAE